MQGVSLTFDLAEAINLLAGGALGEGSTSIRSRLEHVMVRRQLKKTLRSELTALGILHKAEIDAAVSLVVSDRFAALIAESPDTRASDEDDLARILARLDPREQVLVVHRIRQIAVAEVLRNASVNDAVVLHMLKNIDEASLFLVNMGLDNARELAKLESRLFTATARPAPPALRESSDSIEARSLLALTVSAAVREFGVVIRSDTKSRDLIEWTGQALDRLIDDFENQVEQILIVLHRSHYQAFYGSARRMTLASLTAANRRLRSLAADARSIAESLERLKSLPAAVHSLATMSTSIVVAEDFLVIRVHGVIESGDVDDNLDSPSFMGELGDETLLELTSALESLTELRFEVRRAVAASLPEL